MRVLCIEQNKKICKNSNLMHQRAGNPDHSECDFIVSRSHYIHTRPHTHTRTRTRTRAHTHTHTLKHTHTYTHTHTLIHQLLMFISN